jgi:hypothetical protein
LRNRDVESYLSIQDDSSEEASMVPRRLILLLVALSNLQTLTAQTTAPVDSARVETIERLFVAGEVERSYNEAFKTMMSAQLKSNPALAGYTDLMEEFAAEHASYRVVKPDLIRAYREILTEPEAQDLIQFYESPVGLLFKTKMPLVATRSTLLAFEKLQAAFPKLIEAMRARAARKPPLDNTPF